MNWTDEELQEALKRNPDLKVAGDSRGLPPGAGFIPTATMRRVPVTGNRQNSPPEGTPAKKTGVSGAGGNKYHVAPKEDRIYGGRVYPSKKQAIDAEVFYTQLQHKLIKGVLEEVPFRLPGRTKGGRPIIHRVDWGIIELNDVVSWYESKGKDLELGRLKRAQVTELYHIKIEIL